MFGFIIALLILLTFACGMALGGYLSEKKENEKNEYEYRQRRYKVDAFMIHNLYVKGKGKLSQSELDIIRGWADHCAKYDIKPSDIRTQLIIKNLLKNKQ